MSYRQAKAYVLATFPNAGLVNIGSKLKLADGTFQLTPGYYVALDSSGQSIERSDRVYNTKKPAWLAAAKELFDSRKNQRIYNAVS